MDEAKQRLGSGVAALVAVNDGRATVAVGVSDDLTARFSAVELVKAAVAAVGGRGETAVETFARLRLLRDGFR